MVKKKQVSRMDIAAWMRKQTLPFSSGDLAKALGLSKSEASQRMRIVMFDEPTLSAKVCITKVGGVHVYLPKVWIRAMAD